MGAVEGSQRREVGTGRAVDDTKHDTGSFDVWGKKYEKQHKK
jgi:hypothetical protein